MTACDIAPTAIACVKANEKYHADRVSAFVCDFAKPFPAASPLKLGSMNLITAIFFFSALPPASFEQAFMNVLSMANT